MPIIQGSSNAIEVGTAPVDGTDAVQDIDIDGSPTGGTFRLAFEGFVTDPIDYDCDDAALEAAVEALPNVGAGGFTVAGTNPNFAGTFGANLAKKLVGVISLYDNSLEGDGDEGVTITNTTPGVDATRRGAKTGALIKDVDSGVLYVNTGTALEPTWTVVGTQT
jgi:hypothetical protein